MGLICEYRDILRFSHMLKPTTFSIVNAKAITGMGERPSISEGPILNFIKTWSLQTCILGIKC